MAKAAEAPAAAPDEEAPAKSKKPIILILVGVIALVVIVAGTMVGTLFITGFFNKPPPSADQLLAEDGHGADAHGAKPADAHGAKPADAHGAKPADAHGAKPADGKDAKGGKDVSGPPKLKKNSPDSPRFEYTYHQLKKDFLSNLMSSKKVMSIQISIMTRYDDRVFENVDKHEAALRSIVLDVLRQTTDADLVKPEFRKDLAIKIRDSMNSLLEKLEDFGGIEEVFFTSFVVQ
ncbi:MAG: flagellar basal body-associated FliL family protein [Rhodoferax sp.]|nr:flagellar basal body-associated FliL family protein [Rhodoferax sp.]